MRQTPSVGVKHRHDGQDHVALASAERIDHHRPHRVQICRAVAIDDTLRVAGGAARVAHARGQVFVGDFKIGTRDALDQIFIIVHLHTGHRAGHFAFAVVHDHEMFHRLECRQQRCDQCEQRAIDEDHFVFRVICDIGQLLGEQTYIQCVQHAPRAWRRKIKFEVSRRVPRKRRNTTVA